MTPDRVSISTRTLIAPIIGAICTAAVGAVLALTVIGMDRSNERLQAARSVSGEIVELQLEMARANAALYQAVSWQGAKVEAAKVEGVIKAFLATTEQAGHRLGGGRVGVGADVLVPAQTALEQYRKGAMQVFDLMQVDMSLANMSLFDAGNLYANLENATAAMAKVSHGQQSAVEILARDEAHTMLQTAVGVVLAAILLAVGIGMAVGRSIAGPIRALTCAMTVLAEGDDQAAIPATHMADEIGAMARAVEVFKRNAQERRRLEEAEREETVRRQNRVQAINRLTTDFDTTIGGMVHDVAIAAEELHSTSAVLSSSAEETTRQAAVVATASNDATANVQTVAAAAEQLSSSITEITRQVARSTHIAARAVNEARETESVVRGFVTTTARIEDVVKMINFIAGQTNLLALNATIEAARAGEMGKGFSVVAGEVKALATQTAKATDEIGQQVSAIQAQTELVVGAIASIATIVSEMNDISAGIAAAVEEQSSATREIARSVDQAAQGTGQVSSTMSVVEHVAGEAGSAAGRVLESSRTMAAKADELRQLVQHFIHEVKAA
jgi:methyl-accepting chemotaxis protein